MYMGFPTSKYIYCIVGNFCRLQIFTDRLVSAKTKIMGVVTSYKKLSCTLKLRLIEGTKIKSAKKYVLKDYRAIPRKFVPTENIPL